MKSFHIIILFFYIINYTFCIEEIRIDLREALKDKKALAEGKKDVQTNHKFNLAVPLSEE